MKRFAQLYSELDETNKTTGKVEALARYFADAPPEDAAWGLYFLIGRRPRRPVAVPKLWAWAMERSGLPAWLFAECYDAVADLAETIAKTLPIEDVAESDLPLHRWMTERLLPLGMLSEDLQKAEVLRAWDELDVSQRLVYNKLITGEFRVGVSQDLVIRAVSQAGGVPPHVVAHRLMGAWEPSPALLRSLFSDDHSDADVSRPYPFCLAHPLQADPASLGDPDQWLAEWKFDGIRAQVIRRQGHTFVWSRGEELIGERFPEIRDMAGSLPDGVVLDGEILAWRGDAPLPFAELQKRIGRKIVGKKLLVDVPVSLVAFDLLEWHGKDMRDRPLSERRKLLDSLANLELPSLRISPALRFRQWADLSVLRAGSRAGNVEGVMLKRLDSPYMVGRKKGYWWKWKIEPHTVDCVLIYAARGSGIRASLYTDYTFGVWANNDDQPHAKTLVPFAKAYSGLTDAEIREVDSWVRRNTLEKFGPVRTVKPELVFELAFEDIRLSKRHKSGIAVRFPRILRWRKDKNVDQADSLETVKALLAT